MKQLLVMVKMEELQRLLPGSVRIVDANVYRRIDRAGGPWLELKVEDEAIGHTVMDGDHLYRATLPEFIRSHFDAVTHVDPPAGKQEGQKLAGLQGSGVQEPEAGEGAHSTPITASNFK